MNCLNKPDNFWPVPALITKQLKFIEVQARHFSGRETFGRCGLPSFSVLESQTIFTGRDGSIFYDEYHHTG